MGHFPYRTGFASSSPRCPCLVAQLVGKAYELRNEVVSIWDLRMEHSGRKIAAAGQSESRRHFFPEA